MYRLRRVYDFSAADLPAVFADRLWARGVKKERLADVPWVKTLAPSDALRRWFHADKSARHAEFCARYRAELSAPELQPALHDLRTRATQAGSLTLLTAAKIIEQSHLPVLRAVLEEG
ncbi:MAG: DUF488 family protein [Neisseria sp.]|nr:DUF488 family protein [Neisseria sp.]